MAGAKGRASERPACVSSDEVGMCREEVELRAQRDTNPVQGPLALDREVGQGSL